MCVCDGGVCDGGAAGTMEGGGGRGVVRQRHLPLGVEPKLQALVYDILPSTTAVFSYSTGP